ncbi:MAG: F0F1 ATP synthase subunit delta [Mariprofundus sp.]|nr:F0F1 ATP synthase subunit delta [Mariprofundus sp.]
MSTLVISRRYAQALFELIEEGSDLGKGLTMLAEVAEVDEVHQVLISPALHADLKISILDKICGGLTGELKNLVELLASRNKLELLPEIDAVVGKMILDSKKEITASVISAVSLSSDIEDQISALLEKESGCKVRVESSLDASLLGGVVVRIGDRQIDYSLRSRLDSMRKSIAG